MNHSGTLYVVATPIGNLQDITLRALDVLKSVDVVAAEDTRHTSGLLSHFAIQKKLLAVHEHNERKAGEQLLLRLQAGESVALVSDAGTPGVSDPGAVVVAMAQAAGIKVVPVPGPSAVIAALSAAGIATPGFRFHGFLPAGGSQRRAALQALAESVVTLVFYEAPHRVLDSVEDMAATLGGERVLTIARELTKTFETIHRLPLAEARAWLEEDANRQRGEFVLLVEPAAPKETGPVDAEAERVLKLLLAELPLKQAVTLATDITGAKKNALYDLALSLKQAE
ncbi:16S rRNA (cytidine(1402)-2'-O)-methyltransferase [Methylobacillus arboreus]|uniref:16S rRNA (cytidine(1402)-2'-O)-methyltransferase n=1 Tax=Methylobacillus arboreus TaxID=755170 RepID=UPI001E3E2F36|nr:16S rRNA (cytidine(1402)-2'-O)-methyltransferase [Methylobacillus arboreus]MCB5190482.1 16S rRNA (cytidine(1402)-2'-O)-methyltransferase [Methylobacillus arboreus]